MHIHFGVSRGLEAGFTLIMGEHSDDLCRLQENMQTPHRPQRATGFGPPYCQARVIITAQCNPMSGSFNLISVCF